jgi:hypothetical protein
LENPCSIFRGGIWADDLSPGFDFLDPVISANLF